MIVVCQCLIAYSWTTEKLNNNIAVALISIGFTVMLLLFISVVILMALALFKFIKVVTRTTQAKQDLNMSLTLV